MSIQPNQTIISKYLSGHPVSCDKTHILLSCWPKSGSTFLQAFLASYINGHSTYLGGGGNRREQELDIFTSSLWHEYDYVVQQHVRYSDHTQRVVSQAHMRPIILVRNIYDAILSHVDHWNSESVVIPMAFVEDSILRKSRYEQIEFAVDLLAPWYVNFFMTWVRSPYSQNFITYERVYKSNDKLAAIEEFFPIIGIEFNREKAELALNSVTGEKEKFRFNLGITGRGVSELNGSQIDRVRKMFNYYSDVPKKLLIDIGVSE